MVDVAAKHVIGFLFWIKSRGIYPEFHAFLSQKPFSQQILVPCGIQCKFAFFYDVSLYIRIVYTANSDGRSIFHSQAVGALQFRVTPLLPPF